jgi:hypothetical protein
MNIARITSYSFSGLTEVILIEALAIIYGFGWNFHLFVRDPNTFFKLGFEYSYAFRLWWELSASKPSQSSNHA